MGGGCTKRHIGDCISLLQESRLKMGILAQVDANEEEHIALAARLGIAPSTLNTVVKNRKDTEKCYVQCGTFSVEGQPETVTILRTEVCVGHVV
jgi:hypothetical protein